MPEVHDPFDSRGTEVGADGIRRYTGLHRNVVALLRVVRPGEPLPEWTAVPR